MIYMERAQTWKPLIFVVLLMISISSSTNAYEETAKEFYIVYLDDSSMMMSRGSAAEKHVQLLSFVKGRSQDEAKESMVYSYTKSFNAFAAKLTKEEANALLGMEEVLSVFRNRYRKLHTTKSWDFLGLPLTPKRNLKMERDIVVGLLDTGITPESESFRDEGLGPPPRKWRGKCGHYANFSGCNNKLIGARYFKLDGNPDPADILSPVDVDGHGTHTSSTLAGRIVRNASLFGFANGTARGAVPSARIAMYKVCWASSGCADMDILAAFDAAIHDGVDVISVSLGGGSVSYTTDSISVGSFHAMKKGILTVGSAGNDGPSLASVNNHAPWILTVAASGIDRGFRSTVTLGNGKSLNGVGVNAFEPKKPLYPIVRGVDVALNSESMEGARFCFDGSLDPSKVKGKLVYCMLAVYGAESVVKGIGGIGAIIGSAQFLDSAEIFMAPGTIVNDSVGNIIEDYIHSRRFPSASAVIHRTHEVRIPAPFVASFSSRGPNPGSNYILKPDIAAPGVDILAAYTLRNTLTGLKGDTQYSKFTLMSGTSMACPHAAAVAAYVKSFHPNWTAAAIKSAIITSAKSMNKKVNREAEFAYGAGQLNPVKAINPGLIYDLDEMSYIQFLCHEGYTGSSIAVLVGSKSINCSSLVPGFGHDALNYPSMQLRLKTGKGQTIGIFKRSVTNVGPSPAVYNATIKSPKGVEITVTPSSLSFCHPHQKRDFEVVVKAKVAGNSTFMIQSGSLVWRSAHNSVRSPIIIYSLPE